MWIPEDKNDCALEADILFSVCENELNAATWVLLLIGVLTIATTDEVLLPAIDGELDETSLWLLPT